MKRWGAQLAASMPSLSDGGRTAEIKLREGVKFNDDTPFDAEAVKKSLDRHRTLEASARKSELLAVKSVEVVDPQTVRIHLAQPFAPLAAVLADRSGMVMSPKQLDKLGAGHLVACHQVGGDGAAPDLLHGT